MLANTSGNPAAVSLTEGSVGGTYQVNYVAHGSGSFSVDVGFFGAAVWGCDLDKPIEVAF